MHRATQFLDLVEQQFHEVASLLAQEDPTQFAQASAALHTLTLELVRLMAVARRHPDANRLMRQRLKLLAIGMQTLRDNLSRRAAFVDRSVAVLFPAKADATYSAGGARRGNIYQQPRSFRSLPA